MGVVHVLINFGVRSAITTDKAMVDFMFKIV